MFASCSLFATIRRFSLLMERHKQPACPVDCSLDRATSKLYRDARGNPKLALELVGDGLREKIGTPRFDLRQVEAKVDFHGVGIGGGSRIRTQAENSSETERFLVPDKARLARDARELASRIHGALKIPELIDKAQVVRGFARENS